MQQELGYSRGKGGRHYSEAKKRKLCFAWQKSGLSKKAFVQLHKISSSALYRWCKTYLPSESAHTPSSSWLPISVTENAYHKTTSSSRLDLALTLSDFTCHISGDPESIALLLQALRHAAAE